MTLTVTEQSELASLEGKRRNTGLSNREGGRYDWLKWGKEQASRKRKEQEEKERQ